MKLERDGPISCSEPILETRFFRFNVLTEKRTEKRN